MALAGAPEISRAGLPAPERHTIWLAAPVGIIAVAAPFPFLLFTLSSLVLALFALPPLVFFLYNAVLLFFPKTFFSFLWRHG
jgi:hypothetical protein